MVWWQPCFGFKILKAFSQRINKMIQIIWPGGDWYYAEFRADTPHNTFQRFTIRRLMSVALVSFENNSYCQMAKAEYADKCSLLTDWVFFASLPNEKHLNNSYLWNRACKNVSVKSFWFREKLYFASLEGITQLFTKLKTDLSPWTSF